MPASRLEGCWGVFETTTAGASWSQCLCISKPLWWQSWILASIMIKVIETISEAFNSKQKMQACNFDLSKELDSICHTTFLKKKMEKCHYPSLKNRKQSVVCSDISWEWQHVNCGVPQGSVLGPLLLHIVYERLEELTSISRNWENYCYSIRTRKQISTPLHWLQSSTARSKPFGSKDF